MTEPTMEWYREQSEYNRRFYERLQAAWPDDLHDWKVAALFYSALHRVNYLFVRETGRAPGSHLERNRRVRRKLPRVRVDYGDLYTMSLRARYRDGHRVTDERRQAAVETADRIEGMLPF